MLVLLSIIEGYVIEDAEGLVWTLKLEFMIEIPVASPGTWTEAKTLDSA